MSDGAGDSTLEPPFEPTGALPAVQAARPVDTAAADALGRRREQRGWYFYDWADSAFSTTVVTVFLGPYLSTVAKAAADAHGYVHPLGLDVRADRLATVTATLAGIGAPLHTWYGVRVFTDTAADDAPLPADLETLLTVEERAGRTDPYRGVAALLHLCGVRG